MLVKKALSIVLVLLLGLSLVSCGGTDTGTSASPSPSAPASTAPSTEPSTAPDTGSAEPSANAPSFNLDNVREQTFILAHGIPAQAMTGLQYHAFCEAVKELSGGKMVIEERVGGTLITDTETLDAIMNGTVDFVHSMGSYITGTIPNIAPLTVYGYYSGDDWLGTFAPAVYDKVSEIYDEFGIHFVGSLYQGTMVIVCTEKQIKTPSDLNGLFFRTSGTWVSKVVQAWGATPTTIGLADLTTAFERNTVQGTTTGWNIAVPFALYEVAEYITFTDVCEGFAALLMNGDRWDSLNDDEKAIINEAGKMFEKSSVDIALELREGYRQTVEDYGTNTYQLTPEEQKQFTDIAAGVYDEIAKECTQPGLDLIEILKELNP
jgi:TRAP-type C4-dicarboxylate transport system substrate-binding protein